MATVANGMDFLVDFFTGKQAAAKAGDLEASMKIVHAGFGFLCILVFGFGSDADFSAILTAGVAFQFLGFFTLCLKVYSSKSVAGLSGGTLFMYFLFYCFRLTSTTLRDGYIPVDRTGDYILQMFEFATLLCVGYLIHSLHKAFKTTYQEEYDDLSVRPLVLTSLALGICIHGDFNKSQFFDSVWSTSLNLETLALIPQLWMMARIGGAVDTAHALFVGSTGLASICRFVFWWFASAEQSSVLVHGHILGCHVLQLLVLADFMFYSAKAWITGTAVTLPAMEVTEV